MRWNFLQYPRVAIRIAERNVQNAPLIVNLAYGNASACEFGLFDPDAYQIVLLDQRNCGRSTPHASAPDCDLASNTTAYLISDIEQLRQHLMIERWLVFGGSWGSVLALAYAEQHPKHVSELVLFGVATSRYQELDWLFRGGVAIFFPEQWDHLRAGLAPANREGDIVEAYSRQLNDPDPAVCQRAADAWCLWESATLAWPPSPTLATRFTDPNYALAFARIVTHYISHNQWLADGILLHNVAMLADIPGIVVNGRFDFQSPIANAWELHRVWPRSELVIVDNAGHAANNPSITQELIRATDRFSACGEDNTRRTTAPIYLNNGGFTGP